jgi:hypothetical protein
MINQTGKGCYSLGMCKDALVCITEEQNTKIIMKITYFKSWNFKTVGSFEI